MKPSKANPLIRSRLIASFLILAAFVGCQKPQQPRTPIARIDNRTLTLEEVEARFDSSRGISRAQVHEYIQRWITNELLYQEAVRRGLDQSEDVETRLQDIRRQFAINALLDEEIYNTSTQTSPEEEVRSYFENNRDEFLLTQDVALISFIFFRDRDQANLFRTKVTRGTTWTKARNELLANPAQATAVAMLADSSYYTATTLFPSELWRAAVATPRHEPSFPIRTDEGYCVLIVWRFFRSGGTADLAYVRDEILSRLAVNRRQQTMDKLLENLRSNHVVQILISSVPQDSLSLKVQE